MGNKYHFGIIALAIATVMLMVTGPVASAPAYNSSYTLNALTNDISMEFVHVVAGKETALLANVYSYGGGSASSFPVDIESTGLGDAFQWVVIYANLDGYENYLNRRPMESPDGLAVYLTYEKAEVANSLNSAFAAQNTLSTAYGGVAFNLLWADTTSSSLFDFYAFYTDPSDSLFTTAADHTVGINTNGFAGLMSTALVTGAVNGWTGYGVGTFDNDGDLGTTADRVEVSLQGMGWIDEDGVVSSADPNPDENFQHTISTMNIFGKSVSALASPSFGLSRVLFTIPYPISPVVNGISPATTNPLPHVTGQMMWDLRHPTGVTVSSTGTYQVTFNVGMDRGFPMVQNEMVIDQTLLDAGTLQVDFNLKNVGGQVANDVFLNFPLGPDFGLIKDNNITIFRLRDQYSIDNTFESVYTIKLTTSGDFPAPLGTVTETVLDYAAFTITGWFSENSAPAVWTTETEETISLFTGTVPQSGVDVDVDLSITGSNGFPSPLVNAVTDNILSTMPASFATATEVVEYLKSKLPDTLKQAYDESFAVLFVGEEKFIVNEMDFTIGDPIPVAVGPSTVRNEYFAQMNIDSLAVGEERTVSFAIEGIPSKADKLPFMQYVEGTDPVTGGPTAQLISELSDYDAVLSYAFQLFGYDGRPLSFGLPDEFSLEFDSFHSNTYGSMGMAFTWTNDKGFPFFGLSNGLNLQIADDEASVAAVLSLDAQEYEVGVDVKTITVELTNYGNVQADNVEIHLFHSSLGRDYQLFERAERIETISLDGPLLPGAANSRTVTTTVDANSFLGYSPVFAVVEFDSELGQAPESVPDFLNTDPDSSTIVNEASGETHHFVMSTLSGALVLPAGFSQTPSIPEARLIVDSTTDGNTVTYTLTNEGNADTVAGFVQTYDTDDFDVTNADVSVSGTSDNPAVIDAAGIVAIDNIQIAEGSTVTISITFDGEGGNIPPAIVEFTIDGESSLGASVNMGNDPNNVGPSTLLNLAAGAAAQQQSQQSATQDSSSAAYSASTPVGASVNTVQNTDTTQSAKSIIGYSPVEALVFMTLPIGLLAINKRRKH